jgi:hypothetical protein
VKLSKLKVAALALSIVLGLGAAAVPQVAQATPLYSFTGDTQVGATLSANPGYFPDGYSVSYQWRANGANIDGAVDATYTVQPRDVGQRITLVFTAVKPGSPTITKIASNPNIVRLGEMPDVEAPAVYSDEGGWGVGSLLIAFGPYYMNIDPYATVTMTWLRNGVPFISPNGNSYYLTWADLGTNISVRWTETREGYKTISKTSLARAINKVGRQPWVPQPTIIGDAVYGQTLSVGFDNPGCYGCNVNYVWQRNGVAVTGTENQPEYTLGVSDIGTRLTVKLTSTLSGTYDQTRVSGKTDVVARARFLATDKPGITGVLKVGETLSASIGIWDPAASLGYQWMRDGKPIAGATNTSYTLTSSDARKRISVMIVGTASGYVPVSLVSNVSALVQP